ncbi:MAG: alpha/beta fold hydrolase [Saprospiraceae bacterium]|nr:alpha/beta fold hydrolase [Saprospiraceae bacterium]
MVLTPGTTLDNGFSLEAYSPSFLFVNRHFNTMYPYAMRNNPIPVYQRERWETDDGDFFDLDFIKKGSKSIVILLHGLEGSSSSQYILGMANALSTFPIDICAVNHRSCSGELNRTLGFYHSGYTKDLAYIVAELSKKYEAVSAVGYSLGGNMLLKYLGTTNVPSQFKTGIALSVPAHLSSSAVRLNHWTNRPYAIQFLKTLNKKQLPKPNSFQLSSIIKNFKTSLPSTNSTIR